MKPSHATWRSHPFKEGQTYLAQETFVGFPGSEFIIGREYVFAGAAYSHYDSSTIFTFEGREMRAPLYWWWHDEQPESLCQQRFTAAVSRSAQ